MTALAEGQWELDGVAFGEGTRISVHDWSMGTRSVRNQDHPVPFGDGQIMGRDEFEPRTYTWELNCEGRGEDPPADARALERALSVAWRGDGVRPFAGKVLPLRTNVWGGGTKIIYGRPRQYDAPMLTASLGIIPVTAEFVSVDDLLYADEPVSVATKLFALADTGLAGPWHDPLGDSGTAVQGPGLLTNVPGDVPTRLIEFTVTGPCTNPEVQIVGVGSIQIRITLDVSESVTVHIHPSMRKAVLNGGGDVSGQVVGDAEAFVLPPGNQEVRYIATNTSGSSQLNFLARPAFVSA